jgi:hypothetical protein
MKVTNVGRRERLAIPKKLNKNVSSSLPSSPSKKSNVHVPLQVLVCNFILLNTKCCIAKMHAIEEQNGNKMILLLTHHHVVFVQSVIRRQQQTTNNGGIFAACRCYYYYYIFYNYPQCRYGTTTRR